MQLLEHLDYLPIYCLVGYGVSFFLDLCPTLWLGQNPRSNTIYTRNNMGQKCEGNCGLWVLNEILKKTYPENLKKIVGAVWELPAK